MQIAADGGFHFWVMAPNGTVRVEDRKLIRYRGCFGAKIKTRNTSAFWDGGLSDIVGSI